MLGKVKSRKTPPRFVFYNNWENRGARFVGGGGKNQEFSVKHIIQGEAMNFYCAIKRRSARRLKSEQT